MKTRIISALIGLAIAVLAVWQFNSIIFNFFALIIFAIAIHEIYNAFKKGNSVFTVFFLFLLGAPILMHPNIEINTIFLLTLFALGFAIITVFGFEKIEFKSIASTVAFSLYVLVGIYAIVRLKVVFPFASYGWDGAFLFVLMGSIAWGGDVMAYFSGCFFGKHKLAPKLSPKKTIEGAIGGVLGSVIIALIVTFIYSKIKVFIEPSFMASNVVASKYLLIAGVSAVGSCIAILGDLFASAIKRQVDIKDYGSIMPGHGGILDRFDSIFLLAPFISAISDLLFTSGGVL